MLTHIIITDDKLETQLTNGYTEIFWVAVAGPHTKFVIWRGCTESLAGINIMLLLDSVIAKASTYGLGVISIICDGAASNRFYESHCFVDGCRENIYSGQEQYFISDYPHGFKKPVNSFLNSRHKIKYWIGELPYEISIKLMKKLWFSMKGGNSCALSHFNNFKINDFDKSVGDKMNMRSQIKLLGPPIMGTIFCIYFMILKTNNYFYMSL